MPEVNCSYINNMMRHYKTIDINVAVSVPDGLITPVLHDVDKTGLLSLNQQMKQLISKSKEGKLLPEEYAVGTRERCDVGWKHDSEQSGHVQHPLVLRHHQPSAGGACLEP